MQSKIGSPCSYIATVGVVLVLICHIWSYLILAKNRFSKIPKNKFFAAIRGRMSSYGVFLNKKSKNRRIL